MPDEYYIGLISGTSMDGIDAALVKFQDHGLSVTATTQQDYPPELREKLFAASRNPESCTLDDIGELDTQIGECFRDASLAVLRQSDIQPDQVRAIGSHGQTIRHRPDAVHPFTLQLGNPSIIATGTGIDTVAEFRIADMALGGQGAPLTPAFHEWLLRDDSTCRVVLNIGGIANITVLPAGDSPVTGFDTGPGNTLLDAWINQHQGVPFDDGGNWAASGSADDDLLQRLLTDAWFGKAPPKSTGFEYFNLGWLAAAGTDGLEPVAVQATLVELTTSSIADSISRTAEYVREVYVCGGGARNPYLLQRLAARLPGVDIATTSSTGLDPDWVEAVAFAWLAMRRIHGKPGNLPAVTGASRPAILGAVHKS
jgi:anhydro-N-acetylmuramic acid kinase